MGQPLIQMAPDLIVALESEDLLCPSLLQSFCQVLAFISSSHSIWHKVVRG